jgi:hypothetical protein
MASKDDFEKGVAAPTLNKIRIVSPLIRWTLGQERDQPAVPWLALDPLCQRRAARLRPARDVKLTLRPRSPAASQTLTSRNVKNLEKCTSLTTSRPRVKPRC